MLDARVSVSYPNRAGVLRDAELFIRDREIVGLVGQSGSGKTTLGLAIPRLLDGTGARVTGTIVFRGADLLAQSERNLRSIRGKSIGVVFQGAQSALNPALRLRTQFREAWLAHRRAAEWRTGGRARAAELLDALELPSNERFLDRYPAEISVGQAQRVLIAMAAMHSPDLVVADEPTSALDMISQAQVLNLLRKLRDRFGSSVLFISHDLAAVAALCDRVAILHSGRIAETCGAADLFAGARHPYTRSLIDAIPTVPGRAAQSFHPTFV